MNASEGFRESFETIRHNKLRTMLTMLGMNIGVASVIAVMAVGLMSRGAIMRGIEAIGSTLMWVRPDRSAYPAGVPPMQLAPEDLLQIRTLAPGASVTPLGRTTAAVGYRGYEGSASIYGVWPDYRRVWGRELETGRFLTPEDLEARRRVVVLGRNTARALFDSPAQAVGAEVNVGGRPFLVVGVMAVKERSPVDDGSDDDTCYVSWEALASMTDWSAWGGPRVSQVQLKVAAVEDLDEVTIRLERYLEAAHGRIDGKPRFTVQRAEENIQTTNRIFEVITTVVTLIAGISLLVGGIGIMNIMLVAVTERTHEIGVRKALGARRSDILAQFLIESIIICLIGGGLGVVGGIALTLVVSVLQHWEYLLPWLAIILGLAVSVAVGLFFGIYPAVKASRLDPVVALTRE